MAFTSATYRCLLEVLDTIDVQQDFGGSNITLTNNKDSTTAETVLTSTSTPPATMAWHDRRQLTAGSDLLDLNALATDITSHTIDADTLKLQILYVKAAAANTAVLIVADDATNGYHVFGDANGQVSLPAGAELLFVTNDGLPDVAGGSADEIIVTSTDADAIYDIIMVFG